MVFVIFTVHWLIIFVYCCKIIILTIFDLIKGEKTMEKYKKNAIMNFLSSILFAIIAVILFFSNNKLGFYCVGLCIIFLIFSIFYFIKLKKNKK